jgi:LPS sulfotransferase NodH
LSRYYQGLDRAGDFDYEVYQLPTIGSTTFRGPPVNTSVPYLAFIGSAHTFGRFAPTPFPSLLGMRLGLPVLNLAVGGAGPRHYLTQEYLKLINGAEAVVIQIMSGRHASNSLFDNSEHGDIWGRIREDQSTARVDEFFSRLAKSSSKMRFEEIVNETRNDYMSSFIELLSKIVAPKILFWFSKRTPQYEEDYGDIPYGVFHDFPHLVNQEMVKQLAAFSDDYVECISSQGSPQTLWPADQKIDGAVLTAGILENHHYPSPAMHAAAADALESSCRRFSGRRSRTHTQNDAAATRFVIVAAERTGTNLLIGLLNDFPDCYVGEELFNVNNIAYDIIPWADRDLADVDRCELLALRKSDPVAFWKTLCSLSTNRGVQVVGFKLLYSQGLAHGQLLENFMADKTIPIIHLTRRNLLRRLVSERQADACGLWAEAPRDPARARPKVALSINDIFANVDMIETQQAQYDLMFAEHPVLRLIYEDLARRPVHTAERVAGFLGLASPANTPTVKHRKTGQEDLSDAVLDYEALLARMRHWSSFFED